MGMDGSMNAVEKVEIFFGLQSSEHMDQDAMFQTVFLHCL